MGFGKQRLGQSKAGACVLGLVAMGIAASCTSQRPKPEPIATVSAGPTTILPVALPTPASSPSAPPAAPVASAARHPCPEGMVRIPSGTFQMGSNDDSADQKPAHSVTVDTFCLDRTEVTTDAYTACVSAGKCSAERLDQISLDGTGTSFTPGRDCNYKVAGRGNHPINCVSGTQADAYCSAQGKRLPLEEEWEYAARGGTEQRTYPWGDAAPAKQLCWDGDGSDLGEGKRPSTCKVGKYKGDASVWGVQDMGGNVVEWTASRYCPYPSSGTRKDCADERRVLRGGGWSIRDASLIPAPVRSRGSPESRNSVRGFRCAATTD